MKFRPDVGAVAEEELKASAQGQVCLHTREQAPEAALVPPKQAKTIGRRGFWAAFCRHKKRQTKSSGLLNLPPL